jgi:hypothetical protein
MQQVVVFFPDACTVVACSFIVECIIGHLQGEIMSLFQRIAQGLQLASLSFTILWKQKELIFYSLIPALLFLVGGLGIIWWFAMDIVHIKDVDFAVLMNNLPISKKYLYILIPVLNFIITYLVIIANVALIIHTTRLLHGQSASFSFSLHKSLEKWWILVQWTFLLTLANICSYLLLSYLETTSSAMKTLLILLTTGVNMVVMAAVFFVLPFIALERISIVRAVTLSLETVKNNILELLGGVVGIGAFFLVLSLVFIPITVLLAYIPSIPFVIITVALLTVLTGVFLQTITMIFKAVAYDRYYRRNIQELAMAEHDLMM